MAAVRRPRFAALLFLLTFLGTPLLAQSPLTPAAAVAGVRDVAIGLFHTCAISRDGLVFCWGDNRFGQLGDGTTASRSVPQRVRGLRGTFVQVTAGRYHSCALNTAGRAYCWGYGSYGQLGVGSEENSSVPVTPLGFETGAQQISASDDHTCGIDAAGIGRCWGENRDYQLGDGTNITPRTQPVAVTGLPQGVTQIETASLHSCALTAQGRVMCWGSNERGQLGLARAPFRSSAAPVASFPDGNLQIALAGGNTCALNRARRVLCWGVNESQQLGAFNELQSNAPVRIAHLASGIADLTFGATAPTNGFGCALNRARRGLCWGDNSHGQLGDGTQETRGAPALVDGLGAGIQRIVGGSGAHACAILRSGALRCWGDNFYGQLGDGTTDSDARPVVVLGRLHQR